MNEMTESPNEESESLVSYWHDVGHAEVQQRLGFASHEGWLSQFKDRMVGVHLHDIRCISRSPGARKGDHGLGNGGQVFAGRSNKSPRNRRMKR
jgi:hypothetical protein